MGFWVGVNSKNPLKSGLFDQKVGVYSRKTPKTGLFTLPGALFKSGAAMTRIRYIGISKSEIHCVQCYICSELEKKAKINDIFVEYKKRFSEFRNIFLRP